MSDPAGAQAEANAGGDEGGNAGGNAGGGGRQQGQNLIAGQGAMVGQQQAVPFVGNNFSFYVTENGDIMVHDGNGNSTKKLVDLPNRVLRKICLALPGVSFPNGRRGNVTMIENIREQLDF